MPQATAWGIFCCGKPALRAFCHFHLENNVKTDLEFSRSVFLLILEG
jgi:hypothetical protein